MHSERRNERLKFFEEKLKVSPGVRYRPPLPSPLPPPPTQRSPATVDKLRGYAAGTAAISAQLNAP